MKLNYFKLLPILLFIVFSCKKKEKDDAIITAGFTTDSPTFAIQGSTDTYYIKIGLSTVADRDVYIKYGITSYDNCIKILDNSYCVIKKGQQFRSIPFTIIDKQEKFDYDNSFYITEVYNATKDSNTSSHDFKIKTNYLPTAATGSAIINNVNQTGAYFFSNYTYDYSTDPIVKSYLFRMDFLDNSSLQFDFYKFPEEGKTYTISTAGSTVGYVVKSVYYYIYSNDQVSGTLTVDKLDPVNKTIKVTFDGTYGHSNQFNSDLYNINGTLDFSRYNFD